MIQVTNATVRKGQATILDCVSAVAPHGSLTAFIGPNGAGKTTLLRVIAGLEPTNDNAVVLNGNSLNKLSPLELAKTLSWVPTSTPVPFAFTALETVALGLFSTNRGVSSNKDYDRARASLGEVDALHLVDRDITTLSSGERQRVMIARAIVADCPILLLDEPLANLDIAASIHLLDLLKKLSKKGTTICASFHDIALARQYSDHVFVLNNGKIAAHGRTKETLTSNLLSSVFAVRVDVITTINNNVELETISFRPL